MIVRLKDTQKAEKLFGDWPEAIIWSCLQGVMGAVYADDSDNPQAAMAVHGDFVFLAGKPHEELTLYRPAECSPDFIIMVPQNDGWADLIVRLYGASAKTITRYAIKKEGDIFDREHLKKAAGSLPSGYEMKRMDSQCFKACGTEDWSRDLVSQFADYETFQKLGLGVVVFRDGELAAGASTYARYRDGIEIEIDTKEAHRRKGLAYACGAGLILECLERGLYPSWDAHNRASVALAQKLGYHYDHEYLAYEVCNDKNM